MIRIHIVHWNLAEAGERAERLRKAGYRVSFLADPDSTKFREIRDDPPDVFVIDLNRLPYNGRGIAVLARQSKATRHVPIVFVEGAPEKVAGIRQALPDALYTDWAHIRQALRKALKSAPQNPVVPGTMDAYSGTPLPKKLGLKAGSTVVLLGAPPDFAGKLDPLPRDLTLKTHARGQARTILLFAKSLTDLQRKLPAASRIMIDGGGMWIAWPKKTSGVATDLSETNVRATGMGAGLVDYKVCAIDETWSGLLFARRHRPAASPMSATSSGHAPRPPRSTR